MVSSSKKDRSKIRTIVINYYDMLLMVEKGIRAVICPAIHQYAKVNNKYKKDYDKYKELSYLKYGNVDNLYGWAMLQKLLINNFQWIEDVSQFNEYFIKCHNEESDEGDFLEFDVQYPGKLHELDNDLQFLPERMKIKKVEKLATNLHDQTEYFIHTRHLKQALNHGLVLKKVYRRIKFTQKVYMNTKLRQKANNNFEKDFFKLTNNAVFGKTMETMRKHRRIKLLTKKVRRNYLVSEPNYHTTTKIFTKNLLEIEKKKIQILMNKPVYLG